MSRSTWIALLLCTFVLPSGITAQQDATPGHTRPGGPPSATTSPDDDTGGAEIFLGAFRAIRNYHMDSVSDSALWEMALQGLIEELDDPYAVVFTPEEFEGFQENNTGNYAGIGVTISQLNDRITITAVFRDAPADEVGLQVGDYIVGVDGEDARGWTVEEASERIRGPEGSTVDLRVAREGLSESLPFTVPRDRVHVSAVTAEMVTESVGYIMVDRVARNSAAEMDSALTHLNDAQSLVLDLRRNPGGYLDEALDLADLFLDEGQRIASARSRVPGDSDETREETWEAEVRPRLPDVPVVVLVDQYSASASEIIAGALQDHDRALVMGERTFGKGVVQTVMRIPGDRRIRLTTGTWYTPLGRSLHRPRDAQGRPVPRDVEGSTVVTTDAGREIQAGGGGIFPDLPVKSDTLSSGEQALIRATANAETEIPLNIRLAEFAFEQSQGLRQTERLDAIELDAAAFDAFLEELVAEGLPADVAADPGVRSFLSWRIRGQIANRLERTDLALHIRRERDSVLDEAVRLLESVDSQTELFAAARARLDADDDEQRVETAAGATVPPRDGTAGDLNR
ncbi:MAG: S41 family peptidase [Longimicrobiales bacterium]|nr:S41 family peptidase [Longimicrobiales bacterium]